MGTSSGCFVDLHTHSTASDGSCTPSAVASLAAQAGLCAFALSDHNTVSGLSEAETEAKRLGIGFVPALELAAYDKCEIHLLGYFINARHPDLQRYLCRVQEDRLRAKWEMVEKLVSLGIDLSMDDVRRYTGSGAISRVHIARALMDKGIVQSVDEAFSRYLKDGGPAYVRGRKPLPEEAIAVIRKAGGVPVLAHPFQYYNSVDQVEYLVRSLKEMGLLGVECYYSRYSSVQENALLALARRNELVPTGGSDFHGENKPDIQIGIGYGALRVPAETVDGLYALAGT